MEQLNVTQTFWIGVLGAVAVSAAMGLTYVAFHADRGFQFGVRTLFVIVSGMCVLLSSFQYLEESNIWLSLLFIAVSLPVANLLAIAVLAIMVGYWNKSGKLFGKSKIEPYAGPVRQRPIDVDRPDRRPRQIENKRR